MRTQFLATTAISFALATAAFAQSPNTTTNPNDKPAAQSQPQTKQSAPSSSTSSHSSTSQSSTPNSSAQNSATGTGSSSTATSNNAASSDSHTPNTNSTSTSQAPAKSGTASQAQKSDSNGASSNSSTQHSANPPASNSNQAQQAPSSSNTGTAQQGSTAQQSNSASSTTSSSTNINANVNINDQQRTRISQSLARTDVRPLTNVNFSLSVGTVIPHDVHLATLPADVVEIVPQYRGYSFVVVRDEIVIVEPSSHKIVTTLPYRGGGTASATTHKKVSFSERDREVIRKHAKARVEQRTTTGSTARTELRVGERVPETVEIEAFPEEVYREAPELREYRYIRRESHTFVVDPAERTVIEEID